MSRGPFMLSGEAERWLTQLRKQTEQPAYRRGGIPGDPCFMPCRVSKDGGADGDVDTQCSWTYTVMTLDGQVLLEEATPTLPRPEFGPRTAQIEVSPENPVNHKFGQMFIDSTGTLRLYDAGEVDEVLVCPEPP